MTQSAVTYKDHMGTDYSPIEAAIVSNGATNTEKYVAADGSYTKAATSLINFLARGCTSKEWDDLVGSVQGGVSSNVIEETLNHVRHMPPHWTPFGQTAIKLHLRAPLFVARQLQKHQVGFIWNEISRRYVDDTPEFYLPDVWRGRAADKKQGSAGAVHTNADPDFVYHTALRTYNEMLAEGVAPEMARMVLPQGMMTEWYWTGNLYGFSRLFVSRTDPHTQKETQDVAHMIGEIIKPLFPISWTALTT